MYLRPHCKWVNGERYEYWSLVKSVRTGRGPRQRTVAFIGKEPEFDRATRVGWERIGEILSGRAHQDDFLEGPRPDPPEWATVDVSRAHVERLRNFGSAYLGLALWRRLELDAFFNEVIEPGREDVAWPMMACILALARFCAPSSELQIADSWYGKTALDDLLDVPPDKVNDDRLYRALDAALPCRERLFKHLRERYAQWFGTEFDILLYDITSTYFEGQMKSNEQARLGYSRDSRPDCVQVCIGLIVTPDGLPLAYEVFDGNRTDVTTVTGIIEFMRQKYGHERRVWVMDRGMVSEENLEQLREWKASYLVGTPKAMLKQFEQELLAKDWTLMDNGVEVKLCHAPDGSQETFVLCRAPGRIEKEKAMRERQVKKFEEEIKHMQKQCAAEKRALRDRSTAERRVGRLLERFPAATRLYEVEIREQSDPSDPQKTRLTVDLQRHDERAEWAEQADGCYLLRTNLQETDPARLWKIYIGLTQVEFSFRVTKTDFSLRPIYHHHKDRTQAHIMVCFLALVMWRALEKWMDASGLGTCPRKLLEEMAGVRSMDIVLPTKTGQELRLRVVSRPEERLAMLLRKLGLPLPNCPKFMANVVPKNAS